MLPSLQQDYQGGLRIAEEPPVYLFDDFLSAAECDHLVALASPNQTRSLVSGGEAGIESDGRTGGVHWVAHDTSAITLSLSQRLSRLVGLPLEQAESIQVISYGPGQEYRPHYDAWEAGTETGDRCLARGGQRLVTCLCYLNDVEQGGGTFFPRLDIEVTPRRGRMVLFHNCYEGDTRRHPDALHGGLPPEAGEKWACNIWFRERALRTTATPLRPGPGTRRF
ncbi:MAG: 2OG-Fe(II) oxygenase [Halieaceae bacterium]|nr:2OG-Fe(II) oxygenase [Halieaceae bacterium]